MNQRVEVLKKIASVCRRFKMPDRWITLILAISLACLHIIHFIIILPKRIFMFLFPNRRVVLTYSALIMLVMITVTVIIKVNGPGQVVYGEPACSHGTEDNSHQIPIGSNGNLSNTQGEFRPDQHTPGETNPGHSQGELSNNGLPEGVASAGELWYQNVATSGELVDGNLTREQINRMRFLLKVNRLKNCITVYIQDDNGEFTIPVKAMRCSTGGDNTPLGVYKTTHKYEFRKLLFDVYGQYATRIVGQILFHSSSYESDRKDTLIAEEFNKLGEPVSHGCIRLTVEDAKWIYEYCRLGTTVEIYEDEDPGPLGIPEVIKLPEDTVWDPTDPSEDNPWNDKKPEIIADDTIYVIQGHKVDLLEKVTALDTCGNDITEDLKITGSVNCNVTGTYKVTYAVTDLLGRSAEKTIRYIVR